MQRIVWLASYPKSGNTWFRVFLSNLLQPGAQPASINAIVDTEVASSRRLFDQHCGVAASELSADEIDNLRPRVYEALSEAASGPVFHKIHDALGDTPDGGLLVSLRATRCALYFIRNPLDVVVSFAHHSGIDVDRSIAALADPGHAFSATGERLHRQLRQKLSSWDRHVRSWTVEPPFPVHVVRYEDLHRQPLATFGAAARFAGLDADDAAIQRAIDRSAFADLQRQEAQTPFRENRHPQRSRFFRRGVVGGWRDELSADQVQLVIANHRDLELQHGYLDDC